MALALAELRPEALTAPAGHLPACDSLFQSFVTRGYAVISLGAAPRNSRTPLTAAVQALNSYWALPAAERAAMQPLQPCEGCGHRELTDDREVLELRAGPWLREDPPLPALLAASLQLDGTARGVLAAALRSQYLRLPGSSLALALDDLPLPPHAWASSSLQCFSYGGASGGCAAHVDKGLLTLIYSPGHAGLQVQDARGSWVDVPGTGPQEVVVLPGHTLEYATCGLVKAASHRVVLAAGQERQCMVYKLAASPTATIHLQPALAAAGHSMAGVADRYQQPASVQQILDRFNATHTSVNPSRAAQPAAAQAPAAPAAAAAAGAAAADAIAPQAKRARTTRQAAQAAQAAGQPSGRDSTAHSRPAGHVQQPRRGRGRQPPGAASKLRPQPADDDSFIIKIRDQGDRELLLRVQPTTPWQRIMNVVSDIFEVPQQLLRFVFDGVSVRPDATPASLDMAEGDTVDAIVEQQGD